MNRSFLRAACVLLLAACVLACTEDEKKIKVVCWGDSLTSQRYGSGDWKSHVVRFFTKDVSWPNALQGMLGDEYEVINCGIGGENILTIMARQGSAPMALAHDVVVYDTENSKFDNFVGNSMVPAFYSTWRYGENDTVPQKVLPLLQDFWQEGYAAHVNPVKMGGRFYDFMSEVNRWSSDNQDRIPVDEKIKVVQKAKSYCEYNYFLKSRDEQNYTDTIKAGTIIETDAMRKLRGADVNVFFVGQNGGFRSVAEYIAQIRAMIDYSRTREYLVISFHKPTTAVETIERMKEMEDSLAAEFGQRFIPLRQKMIDGGLASAGFTATQEDKDSIAHGQVPPQLLRDGVHFVPEGYRYIAELVFEKLKLIFSSPNKTKTH